MALFLADRVKETSTTTGTGALTLAGAFNSNYRTAVAAGITNGDTLPYSIEDTTNGGYETGTGTYSSGTLIRDAADVYSSSNSGALVNWPAGTRTISLGLTAELFNNSGAMLANARGYAMP